MKYRVEFGFGENFVSVDEWQTIDELMEIEAENAEEAAKNAACADGLEEAMFRCFELIENEFGEMEEKDPHNPEYFEF